jgi:hypothetical protein
VGIFVEYDSILPGLVTFGIAFGIDLGSNYGIGTLPAMLSAVTSVLRFGPETGFC